MNLRKINEPPVVQNGTHGPIKRVLEAHYPWVSLVSKSNPDKCEIMCGLILTWIIIFGCNEDVAFFFKMVNCNISFWVYVKRLNIIDLATYVTKSELSFSVAHPKNTQEFSVLDLKY